MLNMESRDYLLIGAGSASCAATGSLIENLAIDSGSVTIIKSSGEIVQSNYTDTVLLFAAVLVLGFLAAITKKNTK